MKILITGGAGFIGSEIARACLQRGDHVTVLDNLSTGARERVPAGAAFVLMDIRDPLVRRLLAEERFDLVNHQAAHVSVREAMEHPGADAEANVLGTINLLQAAEVAGVTRFVYASSCAAYGEPATLPADEDTPLRPKSPYGISKAAAESYVLYHAQSRGLAAVALRYANVFGPFAGVQTETGVINLFARQLADGRAPTIFGDGEQTRDFVFVSDVVQANLAAHSRPTPAVLNVSTGQSVTVNQLFQTMAEIAGFTAPAERAPAVSGEIRHMALSNQAARRWLSWEPRIAFREGLRQVIAFTARPAVA